MGLQSPDIKLRKHLLRCEKVQDSHHISKNLGAVVLAPLVNQGHQELRQFWRQKSATGISTVYLMN